jgi:hypothetical protein
MTKTLDVYRDWLKISETARPLNHYQLLRLKKFEDDPAKVREHYRAMNAHVRKFATGEFATQSQELLNELAKAMLCLTDARRKGEYDASMGRADAGTTGKARTFEQILLATKVIDQAALDKARNFAKAINVEVRDALVQQKLAKYEAVLPAYAESIGLPYLDLTDIPLDARLIAGVPAILARTHSCVPVLVDNKQLLMASPNPLDPNVEEELRLRFNMPVRTVLCSPANINDALSKFVPRDGSMPEPAAAAATPTDALAQAAAAPAPASAKKPSRPPGPMSPEEIKERRDYTLLAVGMTTIVTMNAQYYALGLNVYLSGSITLVLAGIAGWITWTKKTA